MTGMRYVNGLAGLVLLIIALSYLDERDWATWLPIYGFGALVAFSFLKTRMPVWATWICAAAATGATFSYFAFFFQIAPHLRGDWIAQGHACSSLLLAAFCMIPVLAGFSRRLKAGPEAQTAAVQSGWRLRTWLSRRLARLAPRRSPTPHQIRPTTR